MTVRAEIRHLLTPGLDPDTHVPTDPDQFFLVQLIAGPVGGPGEESFQFLVCTPAQLAERVRRDGPLNGHHLVIVEDFHWPTIRRYFERLVARVSGRDWREVADKLGRYGLYEFEDYT